MLQSELCKLFTICFIFYFHHFQVVTNQGESKYSSSLIVQTHHNKTEFEKLRQQMDEKRKLELTVLTKQIKGDLTKQIKGDLNKQKEDLTKQIGTNRKSLTTIQQGIQVR